MLSPKMQRAVRVNDAQLVALAERAHYDNSQSGYLHKRTSDNIKWQMRWFVLYQNLLFYYETENSTRPAGVLMLEGSYCERVSRAPHERNASFCFTISYRRENLRQYELRAATESDCVHWIELIRDASFNKVLLQKEELEQKQLHLLQVVESERTARWQYAQQCDELVSEVKKLRSELCALKKEMQPAPPQATTTNPANSAQVDPTEIKKIKKVQSFFRGWLCRRRWKQIVDQYIKSPHAESMRKRNSLVFLMVEAEEEYMEQLEVLVSCFLRPFKMAASSKKPPCTHEDVNSIFLNSETVLFLHQIFLKGLTSRMESWPTLVLGDLFDMLLPMLTIYQEYVRNHHYSLRVLTECKQSATFAALVARLEAKPACQGRSLDMFLTYPMHQIPRYIITLHELLAHTPHDHVERQSLQHAREQLEELSRQMHDEVSETENLRKNLGVERMIIEGCDILLDVNQVFVRQGCLSQVVGKGRRATLQVRQTFLFSNHLLLATRAAGGRLHLPQNARLPLADALLIEDLSLRDDDDAGSVCSSPGGDAYQGRDFKIVVDMKGEQIAVHLVASTLEEKAAWTSDISQCMDNAQINELLRAACSDSSSVSLPHCRNDRSLFTDDVDIRFSRTLNSCKVPQIRCATPQRLLQRLTDLRFLSVDFLNTFLLTYRVFTDSETVLEALKQVFYEQPQQDFDLAPDCMRKASGASSVSGYGSEQGDRDWQARNWRSSIRKCDEEWRENLLSPRHVPQSRRTSSAKIEEDPSHLTIPKIMATSSSSETLKGNGPSSPSPSALSSTTLVAKSSDDQPDKESQDQAKDSSIIIEQDSVDLADEKLEAEETLDSIDIIKTDEIIVENIEVPRKSEELYRVTQRFFEVSINSPDELEAINTDYQSGRPRTDSPRRRKDQLMPSAVNRRCSDASCLPLPESCTHRRSISERRYTSTSIGERKSKPWSGLESRSSVASQITQNYRRDSSQPRAGVVITSFRQSHRRSSTSTAAAAFAVATSASSNPREPQLQPSANSADLRASRRESVISTAATMRVLNVLRHWISKHSADFSQDQHLRTLTAEFLDDIVCSPGLLPAEQKAASQLLRLLARTPERPLDIAALLAAPLIPSKESVETLSALEIAEQMTYLDHQIFRSIHSEEFLGQAWTKADKIERAPHILAMTRHFNHISTLVISEILKRPDLSDRAAAIEKWAAVADIAKCLHNYNSVLQVSSAFTNTSIYRLKKTWEKVSKTTKQTIEKLQCLVSSDGRFRALREALHSCDPPCIPYLGMYLSDLSFIEEGTPNFTPEGLLNFSKMRMIAHVIREIRHFQQMPYKIEHIPKVCEYLLDPSLHIEEEDDQYQMSLELEPRAPRVPPIPPTSHNPF